MAKAQFHKNQRVWVECVGAWATIEKIVPVWAKGFDEPVRISYEVGLGREFAAHELEADRADDAEAAVEMGEWRLLRARNKWQSPEECAHHPFPGSYPVVVTDAVDWGGWRVPGAEYDRDPNRIEVQARLLVAAPKLMRLAKELIASVSDSPEDAPPGLVELARRASAILATLSDRARGSEPRPSVEAAEESVEEPAAPEIVQDTSDAAIVARRAAQILASAQRARMAQSDDQTGNAA